MFFILFFLSLLQNWQQWEGEVTGKGGRRVKWCKVNAKMIPVETIPGIEGRRIKENSRGGEFMYDTLDTL
jgi:hypothetical protein